MAYVRRAAWMLRPRRICSFRHFSGCNDPPSPSVASIDRSGLFQVPEHAHGEGSGKKDATAMAKHIRAIVRFRGGPITVAEYMEEVLTNAQAGFYVSQDAFGSSGSFITSPDISQMFGEMVGIWSMCMWQQMGQPKHVQLVELGPGRGTLMADLLRGISKFKEFSQSLSIHFVECSPSLRELQHQALRCISNDKDPRTPSSRKDKENTKFDNQITQVSGSSVSWYLTLEEVPRGVPTIIVAHEFLDALPIHQFQKTSRGWCEKLVDVSESGEGFRFVLSPGSTAASRIYLPRRLKWASIEEKAKIEHIEVCPGAWKVSHEIAKRVGEDSGAALIIDYGEDGIISDSLQGIKSHRFVHVLDEPGEVDLSAYVDFSALKGLLAEVSGSSVHGPISQSNFLGALGINFRLEALLKNAKNEEQAEALKIGYWRLVGEGELEMEDENESITGMGLRYKALAIVDSKLGPPICF